MIERLITNFPFLHSGISVRIKGCASVGWFEISRAARRSDNEVYFDESIYVLQNKGIRAILKRICMNDILYIYISGNIRWLRRTITWWIPVPIQFHLAV